MRSHIIRKALSHSLKSHSKQWLIHRAELMYLSPWLDVANACRTPDNVGEQHRKKILERTECGLGCHPNCASECIQFSQRFLSSLVSTCTDALHSASPSNRQQHKINCMMYIPTIYTSSRRFLAVQWIIFYLGIRCWRCWFGGRAVPLGLRNAAESSGVRDCG